MSHNIPAHPPTSLQRPVDTHAMEKEMEEKMKTDMIQLIIELIVDMRSSLDEAFRAVDVENTGQVTRNEWSQVMKQTTDQPGLPFLALQPDLCEVGEDGSVDYNQFLERYVVTFGQENEEQSWADGVIDDICSRVGAMRLDRV